MLLDYSMTFKLASFKNKMIEVQEKLKEAEKNNKQEDIFKYKKDLEQIKQQVVLQEILLYLQMYIL